MRRVIRGVVKRVVEGAVKLMDAAGFIDEIFLSREYFQHYGITSSPLPGAEAVMVREGNMVFVVATDDRRYRISLENGEVALYDDQGQKVHFKRNNAMEVVCTGALAASAAESMTATCPLVTVVAAEKVTFQTPLAEYTGNLSVAGDIGCQGGIAGVGNISSDGNVSAQGDVSDGHQSMAADRAVYNGHNHPGDSGGTTGTPNQEQ